MERSRHKPPLPAWTLAYVVFRFGDGATHALVGLAVVLHYDLPLWALAVTTASMNLASVPGSFLWGRVVDRVRDPRRFVAGGFALAAACMAVIALLPPFPVFLLAAAGFTVFGVATGPASSLMIIQGIRRPDWAKRTSRLSRRTGFGFLSGMGFATLVTLGRDLLPGLAAFLPDVPFQPTFAMGAALAAASAGIAWRTVGPRLDVPPQDVGFDPALTQAGQRRFERPVFLPFRMRHPPSLAGLRDSLLRPHRLWPIGIALLFTGSVSFFTIYTGVLANHLGLAAGLVLLCQMPSHIVTPLTYTWAGRHGARVGEVQGILHGALLRVIAVPVLSLVMVLVGKPGLPAIVLLHGVMGLSFALIQVNAPLVLAELHPGGRGQGVGSYHASVGLGTLVGSVSAYLILRAVPADLFWLDYVFSVAVGSAGAWLLLKARGRLARSDAPPLAGAAGA